MDNANIELLQTTDIMKMFGITRKCVYNWNEADLLKPIKIKRSLFYQKADVLKLIQDKKRK